MGLLFFSLQKKAVYGAWEETILGNWEMVKKLGKQNSIECWESREICDRWTAFKFVKLRV